MRREDLKDGMIITTEGGDTKIILDNGRYFSLKRETTFPIDCVFAGDDFCTDVVKVEYQGGVIWSRENEKKYYTLEEVIAKIHYLNIKIVRVIITI